MAIKYFCDPCGKQIPDTANRSVWTLDFPRPNGKPSVKVEVDCVVGIDGTTNSGHICDDCIKKTINDGLVKGRTTR